MALEEITISLSHPKALVLFEFLARFEHDNKLEIQDEAEEKVLVEVFGYLQRELAELFDPKYTQLLDAARKEVKGQ